VCISPASPILADEMHTYPPNPRSGLSTRTLSLPNAGIKASVGKAFSFASIGEAGENAFPTGADSKHEPGKVGIAIQVLRPVDNLLKAYS